VALVKKGSRRITVDRVVYRWRVRGRPTYDRGLCWSPLAYAVELAERPGATLVVTTNQPHPSNWFARPATPVRPSDVAGAVRLAQAKGWAPATPGPVFRLDQSEGFAPTK